MRFKEFYLTEMWWATKEIRSYFGKRLITEIFKNSSPSELRSLLKKNRGLRFFFTYSGDYFVWPGEHILHVNMLRERFPQYPIFGFVIENPEDPFLYKDAFPALDSEVGATPPRRDAALKKLPKLLQTIKQAFPNIKLGTINFNDDRIDGVKKIKEIFQQQLG